MQLNRHSPLSPKTQGVRKLQLLIISLFFGDVTPISTLTFFTNFNRHDNSKINTPYRADAKITRS